MCGRDRDTHVYTISSSSRGCDGQKFRSDVFSVGTFLFLRRLTDNRHRVR